MSSMQPIPSMNSVLQSVPPVLPPLKEDSNLLTNIAVPILQALGLLLVLGGIGCFIAAFQIPATVCLVTGLAVLVLGFAIERCLPPSPIAPTFESTPLSEALLAAIQKIPAVPPLENATLHAHLNGATLGQGVGDAIGLATEFKSKKYAKDNFHGKELEFGHEAFTKAMAAHFPAGAVTDDTEQATAIIRAIAEHQLNPEKSLAISFAEQMKHWAKNGLDSFNGKYVTNESVKLTQARDIGSLTREVLARSDFLTTPQAAAHSVWLQTKNKASNGSVMRTSSVATIYHRDLAAVVEKSILFASVTHADPRSISGAVALSVAIALSIRGGLSVAEIMQYSFEIASIVLQEEMQKNAVHYTPEELQALTAQYNEELHNYIATSTWDSLDLGNSNGMGYAYKCMGAAFAALRRVEELGEVMSLDQRFRTVIQEIVEEAGDADTNAAAAGALLGAYLGEKAMPASWLSGLNDNSRGVLEENIRLVAQLSGAPPALGPRTWVPKGEVNSPSPAVVPSRGPQVSPLEPVAPPKSFALTLENAEYAPKFFALPDEWKLPKIPKPLTKDEVIKLLSEERSLQGLMIGAKETKQFPMVENLANIHEQGIPAALDPDENDLLMHQMQYIMYTIAHEPNRTKREDLLRSFGGDLEGACIPVTQGTTHNMCMRLSGQGVFAQQISALIANIKERVLEETIVPMFPAMDGATVPTMQLPHVKNGMIMESGAEIGLSAELAKNDSNANCNLGRQHKAAFIKKFKENILLTRVIQEFVTEVNCDGSFIVNVDFMKWCGQNGLGDDCVHDDDRAYPSYANTPTDKHLSYEKAFIDEATALKVFQVLGYVK